MRAAKRSAAVLPPALKPSSKAHQDYVEYINDVLVDIITLHPDYLITFSLKKNFTPAIIDDLPILRMHRTIDLDDEPCFSAQEIEYRDRWEPAERTRIFVACEREDWSTALLPPVCRRREANERDGSVGVA